MVSTYEFRRIPADTGVLTVTRGTEGRFIKYFGFIDYGNTLMYALLITANDDKWYVRYDGKHYSLEQMDFEDVRMLSNPGISELEVNIVRDDRNLNMPELSVHTLLIKPRVPVKIGREDELIIGYKDTGMHEKLNIHMRLSLMRKGGE